MATDIHPIFKGSLGKKEKELILKQKGLVIWFTGLSGSGKSTIAKALEHKFYENKFLTQILDGDNLRIGINKNLGFSEEDRLENIRRSAETAKTFLDCGIITICSFISPLNIYRDLAKEIIGEHNFFQVFIHAPFEVCEERDVKGLYQKARRGEIKNFTGLDAPFETPNNPNLVIHTHLSPLEKCVEDLYNELITRIYYP